jgi:hypothetical protein
MVINSLIKLIHSVPPFNRLYNMHNWTSTELEVLCKIYLFYQKDKISELLRLYPYLTEESIAYKLEHCIYLHTKKEHGLSNVSKLHEEVWENVCSLYQI